MKVYLLLISALLLFSVSASGQNRQFRELSLSLSVVKPRLLPLEPIPLKLSLENKTDSSITVNASWDFTLSYLSLEIRKPNGETVTPNQLSFIRGRTFINPQNIPPGVKRDEVQVFNFLLQKFFDEFGTYKLRATFKNSDGQTIRSEWAKVTVIQPKDTDVAAYEYIRNKMNSSEHLLLSSTHFSEWPSNELEEFLKRFPNGAYADFYRQNLSTRKSNK